MNIPPVKIYFPGNKQELFKQFEEILNTGQLTLGKYTKELEEKWSSYIGPKFSIAVNSGTAAIELPLRAYDIKDKEVILPTNTFIATANAVVHSQGKPVLADITENMCMDPKSLLEKITPKTKAVIFVHIAGLVSKEILEVKKICDEKNLILIEDAAHAHGSSLNGQKAGTFGDAAAFSFYPTKLITSGEGGIISTNSEKVNEKSRVIRDQGKSAFLSSDFVDFGHNFRLCELNAALALFHFKHLDSFIEERNKIAKKYNNGLKNISKLKPLIVPKNSLSNYYKYIVFLDESINRDKLKQDLKEKYGVCLSGEVYEKPLHLQQAFKTYNYKEGDFPNAERLCAHHICLPIYQTMTDEEINYVINSLKEVIK